MTDNLAALFYDLLVIAACMIAGIFVVVGWLALRTPRSDVRLRHVLVGGDLTATRVRQDYKPQAGWIDQ